MPRRSKKGKKAGKRRGGAVSPPGAAAARRRGGSGRGRGRGRSEHAVLEWGALLPEKVKKQVKAMRARGWVLRRQTKHLSFSRDVLLLDGTFETQRHTLSCTPSDWRSNKNSLASLKRKDAAVRVWLEC